MMIKQLDLSWNGFSDDGAKAMGEMLKTNNTLQHLDLSNNRIGLDGFLFYDKMMIIKYINYFFVSLTILLLLVVQLIDGLSFKIMTKTH